VVEVDRWLDGVQELMSQDATKQGEAERLQEELNQCKVIIIIIGLIQHSFCISLFKILKDTLQQQFSHMIKTKRWHGCNVE